MALGQSPTVSQKPTRTRKTEASGAAPLRAKKSRTSRAVPFRPACCSETSSRWAEVASTSTCTHQHHKFSECVNLILFALLNVQFTFQKATETDEVPNVAELTHL